MEQVLDHGYVDFIESWGVGKAGVAEAGIIEAARQSTQGSFRGWAEDRKLLAYLFNSNPQHATPFEFAGLVIEVQAPIFVFREWHRHRTQSYNEMSARYTPLPDLYYLPTPEHVVARSLEAAQTKNKQAAGSGRIITLAEAEAWARSVDTYYTHFEVEYKISIDSGVPKELARISMPVGHYSRMRAQATLRNWLAFMTLRADPHAQWEIRQFAIAVGKVLESQFPNTWELYETARGQK